MSYAKIARFKNSPMQHHKHGWQFTASGYGSRLPSRFMVMLRGESIWRRVYVICYSNAGSCYVRVKGKRVFVNDSDLQDESAWPREKFVPVVRSFGDGHISSFERVTNLNCRALCSVAIANGFSVFNAHDVYEHMRKHSFKNPCAYAMCEGHKLVKA